MINELVSNSLKHGFPDGRSGHIHVHLSGDADSIRLGVRDDGIGWAAEFDPTRPSSLGLRLVHLLNQQLRGRLQLQNENGIACTLTLPTVIV